MSRPQTSLVQALEENSYLKQALKISEEENNRLLLSININLSKFQSNARQDAFHLSSNIEAIQTAISNIPQDISNTISEAQSNYSGSTMADDILNVDQAKDCLDRRQEFQVSQSPLISPSHQAESRELVALFAAIQSDILLILQKQATCHLFLAWIRKQARSVSASSLTPGDM